MILQKEHFLGHSIACPSTSIGKVFPFVYGEVQLCEHQSRLLGQYFTLINNKVKKLTGALDWIHLMLLSVNNLRQLDF